MSQINANTANLQVILDKISALPDVTTGGSSIETCDVKVSFNPSASWAVCYGAYYSMADDGAISVKYYSTNSMGGACEFTLYNVVCNSVIYVEHESYNYPTASGAITVNGPICYATATSGGTITIS